MLRHLQAFFILHFYVFSVTCCQPKSLLKKLTSRVALLRRLAGSGWSVGATTLRTDTLALVHSTAEYCAPVWCCSAHTCIVDSTINDALRIVTGCMRPTPVDNLPILAGIQPAELRRIGTTLWWLLFVRAWSLLVVRSIDCCSCPEPSCLSVEHLSFIEAWVITALWPKSSCCLVFSNVLCIVWAGCFCRTTIVMTIFWSLVCWNSVL